MGGFRTIKEVKEMDKSERENLPLQYKRIVDNINQEEEADIEIDNWKKDIKVFYISGPSGIGKTETAKQIVRDNADKYGRKINIIKYENGFYLGIGSANIAIYDDFRDSHMKASEFINLIDYNKHYMNIKGGSKINNYNLIVFTSVQRLASIYSNLQGEPREQWERRIEEIKLGEDKAFNFDIDLD